jgi:hypothetical protein
MKDDRSRPSRLSDFNFWNALSRNENYRRDRRFYFNGSPLERFGKERARFERIAQAMKVLGDAALVEPENISKQIKRVKAGNHLSPRPVATLYSYHEKDRITFIKDRRCILIEVDLTAQKDRIEKAVWELIREMRKDLKLSSHMARSPEREPNDDMWDVYDAYKGGKAIYALARQRIRGRFPDKNLKQADRLLSAEDKTLRRYVKKAEFMIRQVWPIT